MGSGGADGGCTIAGSGSGALGGVPGGSVKGSGTLGAFCGGSIGEGATIGADNVVTRGARIFPGVEIPDGGLRF